MSGSAGGNRITRASVAKTTENYINRVLSKFPAFKGAKVSGSYNTSAKEDFGDIDLIVNVTATDKKNIKLELAKFVSSLPDDVIVPFKSEKYKGKKYLNTGEIITILYPIEGQPDQYVQIDNIISISDDEAEFKKEFLDYPAEIQGLLLGLAKVICLEEDPKSIFARMGIGNIPKLEANQEYEFNLSSAGLTLRIVTLDNFKEVDRTDAWKTSNWSNIKKLFTNYKIDGSFEDLLNDISSKVKNPRSKNRIRGIFNSMVSIKSGEVGTPKGDNKQKSLDKVNSMLTETNLGRYIASLILEEDQPTVALYPGKFKPPHKGHFAVASKLTNVADKVIIFISPKTHEGITAQESYAIWELYKSVMPKGDKIELRISDVTPVRDVYLYVEENPNTPVYAAYGKGEEDRYKNLTKYSNAKVFDAGDFDGLSATNFRQALLDGNKEKIQKFIPDGIDMNDILSILKKSSINEVSEKIINKLIAKFNKEEYNIDEEIVRKYIERFDQIKNSLPINKRDILKYSWNELEDTIEDNLQSKRIKAGKLNDGDVTNAELLYNQNSIRVYEGGSKRSCIKYGQGYSFCISARGSRNLYAKYRVGSEEGSYEESGPASIYFVFDDSRSSDKDKNGFIDPTHLLVILVEKGEAFSVTEANNAGEELFGTFEEMAEIYPQLNGLKDILQYKPIGDDDDVKIYNLEQQKEKELNDILEGNEILSNIVGDKSRATKLLKGELQLYSYKLSFYDKQGQIDPYSSYLGNSYLVAKDEEELNKNLDKYISFRKKANPEEDLTAKSEYKLIPLDDEDKETLSKYIEVSTKYDREILKLKLINEILFNEISDKIANQLIAKFTKENPNLDINQAKEYIKRFDQIKSNLPVDKRDILKYSWNDLEQIVAANQSKRTKAGKINDGEPEDANLVYNQNGLRIYVGKTKQACIKYGNGYNFCISSRGEDNLYKDYRYKQMGTPYFVFDDTKTSERDEYGKFIDEEHLLVVFTFNDEDEETGAPSAYYSVTTADNPGEDEYFTFGSIEQSYPKLKGLKDIFKHVGIDPKEKAELKLEKKYDGLIGSINESYGNIGGKNYQEDFWNTSYVFETIQTANNRIDDIINGKLTPYNFIGKVKPEVPGKYVAASMSQIRVLKVGSNIQDEKRKFADEVLANLSYDEDVTVEEALNDWEIKAIQKSAPKEYIEEVKQLVDEYRKELAKLKLMKEGLEPKSQRLTESQTATIGEFIKYACKDLGIQKLPSRLTLSYDTDAAREKRSFGYFDPNNNQIWVYVKNRNMADILRTLAHELVHRKQDEDGRIDYESGETGSDIENEANAKAGVLLRDYGKVDNGIYESKKRK